jgi:hypothetical protein
MTKHIFQAGNVGIGTTAPGLALDVVGNARFSAVGSGATANDLRITSDGTLTTDTSDVSLKTNVESLGGALDKVLDLHPVSFNWLANPDGRKELGLIAQEVAPIFPELTFTNPVDGKMGINYSRIPTLLVKAMQEQQGMLQQVQHDTQKAQDDMNPLQTLIQEIQSLIVALQTQLGLVRTDLDATKDQVASLSASLNSMNVDYTSWKEAIASGSGVLGASNSALLDKVATVSSLLVKDDLEVGGKTTTFDLTVLNKLTSGVIEVGAGVSGDEINSATGIRFQTLAQGPIDFMNGKVVIDVDGSIKAKHLKLDTVDPSSSTAGTAVLKAGKTTIPVDTTSIGPDSLVFITPITLTDIPIAVTQKSPGVGFTVTIPQTISKDLEFQWLVIN